MSNEFRTGVFMFNGQPVRNIRLASGDCLAFTPCTSPSCTSAHLLIRTADGLLVQIRIPADAAAPLAAQLLEVQLGHALTRELADRLGDCLDARMGKLVQAISDPEPEDGGGGGTVH